VGLSPVVTDEQHRKLLLDRTGTVSEPIEEELRTR
jgi:hypothetical protein